MLAGFEKVRIMERVHLGGMCSADQNFGIACQFLLKLYCTTNFYKLRVIILLWNYDAPRVQCNFEVHVIT